MVAWPCLVSANGCCSSQLDCQTGCCVAVSQRHLCVKIVSKVFLLAQPSMLECIPDQALASLDILSAVPAHHVAGSLIIFQNTTNTTTILARPHNKKHEHGAVVHHNSVGKGFAKCAHV